MYVGKFEVEVNVPEVDIAKIAVGNSAKITLDAYGDEVEFTAHVSKYDPAEKIVDGVPTYKTTLLFDKEDARIRSGMTANITIETSKKENVIAIPGRAIITKEGKKYVRVLQDDGTQKEVLVVTGLRGSAGLVEIVSGLKENDRIETQATAS
jgi:multidrug efflux pump subunit AcrA (membrane-fusion protein)